MSVKGTLLRGGIVTDGSNIEISNGDLKITGTTRSPGATSVTSVLRNSANDILLATGTTVPTNGEDGYAKGCLFIDTDVAASNYSLYENIGTSSSCEFNAVGSITSGEISLANGSILIGNASGVAAANTMSGDATISNSGVLTIAAAAVEEAMLALASADGLHAHRVARATYDFAEHGGAVSTIGLGVTLPDNAIVTRSWYEVTTTLTSAADTATVSVDIPTNDVAGIVAAIAINDGTNPWDAGYHEGIQDGTAANFSVKTTAARELSITIGVQAVTAGAFVLFCEYVISD